MLAPIKGYDSVSNAHKNFKRLENKLIEEKQVHVRYFGDLDPSGEHIQENINNELRRQRFWFDASVLDIQRVAVIEEQIEQFTLPRNPDPKVLAKLRNDPRARSFLAKYGELFQIEVDALQAYGAEEFRTMVLDSVDPFFDETIYEQLLDEHSEDKISGQVRDKLKELLDRLEPDSN